MAKLTATTHLSETELSSVMGTLLTGDGYALIDRTVRVVDDAGRFVATMVKDCIPAALIHEAEPALRRLRGDFSNRGSVVGKGAMLPRVKADGSLSKRLAVPKATLPLLGKTDQYGWFDRIAPGGGIVCRQTNWSVTDPQVLDVAGPLLEWVDFVFRLYCPSEHERQVAAVRGVGRDMMMTDGWANLTVNLKARTAVHRDKGDVADGTAALFTFGDFSGGQLLFPRYNLAFAALPGDALYFDPHEPHANAPVSGDRLSVVAYTRARLDRCSR